VVVELAVAVVVAVVVEVKVAVAGGVPFGPPNEIKIKSTLDNILVHLVVNQILLINQKYLQMNHNKFLIFVYEF
jgi:hypothetical protein